MFTSKQKLLMGGAVLFAVLPVADGYYGSRWLFSPNVESVTEYVLPDRPPAVSMNRSVCNSVSQHTPSVPEADLVSEDESFSDVGSTTDTDEILSSEDLKALSDEELTALA